MAIPATGTTFSGAGFETNDPEFIRRGKAVALIVRDARGSATDISPHNSDGSVRWSPFSQDNKLRGDMFARRKVNGFYVTVADANEGFLHGGSFKDGEGPVSKPKISSDHLMRVQSNYPYDSDLTEESEAFSFTLLDTANPVYQRLRNNRPLCDANGNLLLEDPGQADVGFGRLLNGANPGRQFILVRERKWNGLPIYSATGYALARLDDIGNSKMGDKKDTEGAELSYLPLPDGYFMAYQDGEYQDVITYTWWGGAGWTALGGVPTLSASAPVATAGGTAGTATLAFAVPTGTGDPWSYTAQVSTDSGVTWGTAIEPDSVAVSGGTVTLSLSDITAGSSKLRATVTGTNGSTATTPTSNAITVT